MGGLEKWSPISNKPDPCTVGGQPGGVRRVWRGAGGVGPELCQPRLTQPVRGAEKEAHHRRGTPKTFNINYVLLLIVVNFLLLPTVVVWDTRHVNISGVKTFCYFQFGEIAYYNVLEIRRCARGKFQSKTNVFYGFLTVQYSWRVY